MHHAFSFIVKWLNRPKIRYVLSPKSEFRRKLMKIHFLRKCGWKLIEPLLDWNHQYSKNFVSFFLILHIDLIFICSNETFIAMNSFVFNYESWPIQDVDSNYKTNNPYISQFFYVFIRSCRYNSNRMFSVWNRKRVSNTL